MNRTDMTPEEFLTEYGNAERMHQAVLLDVREPAEWDYYHLEGAILMPVGTIPEELGSLPRDRTLYVICAHGVRSEMVCRYLRQNGFRNAVNVEGGMAAVAELRGFSYD
ncbi:rhodanese-like domain-containing protein [Gorillibacterium sp. sgz5001074]|uniref:rhodanese-like domain-containing protein n=1 Tax=Gorillibacterium sp. sgz5001074 TaxID=3446695 RepID=UPI003F66C50D